MDDGVGPLILFGVVAVGVWAVHRACRVLRKRGVPKVNRIGSLAVGIGLLAVLAFIVAMTGVMQTGCDAAPAPSPEPGAETPADKPAAPAAGGRSQPAGGLPRLVDLGSKECIPCKMMAPILEELKAEYAGRLQVDVIDVWLPGNRETAKQYGIRLIPTQIFFAPDGKELWRHEGFLSKEDILAKWKELGYDFTAAAGAAAAPAFERLKPAQADDRPKDRVCYLCDGDIDPKTLVVVKTDKGDVRLCSPHCYFIVYSALTEEKTGFEKKVSVTDYAAGKLVPAAEAVYLCGLEEKTGRPWVRASADRQAALKERAASGGSLVGFEALQAQELACRCGFCDRAVYPQDASRVVTAAGVHTWGCCPHCALGVAARTGGDITVYQPDGLTGKMIVVKTLDGKVASLEPRTAVAWFGMRKKPDGTWGSAGCFHQANFTNLENLKAWVEQHPYETGKQITIAQALAAKMKMTPQQIQKACKIGECAPK